MQLRDALFSSESVTEGHPDKICDQVSDAVLDECLRQDKSSRVALETAVKTGLVLLIGEITTRARLEYPTIVRRTVERIGFNDGSMGFDARSCAVMVAVEHQSPEIAMGVDSGANKEQGAGDQGMMFGYACDESPELMPLPIALAHRLTRRLAQVRKDGTLPWLRPDGKSQVTVEYRFGVPARVDAVVISTQHAPEVDQEQIARDVKKHVIQPVIESHLLDEETKYFINPTGRFVVGGPFGDSGLTGRKIIVDTYGGMARHGGGAFSGKDPTKVDRSAAYAARYVAKNVVAAGLADRFEVQLAYVIGGAHPISLNVETFGTGSVSDETIRKLIAEHFDFRPGAIIDHFQLRRPIYRQTAAYGHFGRPDLDLPWERTDLAQKLARAAGAKAALA